MKEYEDNIKMLKGLKIKEKCKIEQNKMKRKGVTIKECEYEGKIVIVKKN